MPPKKRKTTVRRAGRHAVLGSGPRTTFADRRDQEEKLGLHRKNQKRKAKFRAARKGK